MEVFAFFLMLFQAIQMAARRGGGGGAPLTGPTPGPVPSPSGSPDYIPPLDPIPPRAAPPVVPPAVVPSAPTPPAWPAPPPAELPPFPSGWEPDNPPPPEVVSRANDLLFGLWASGTEGATRQEMTGGRWITYRGTKMADKAGKMTIRGVVAYRVRGGSSVPAPSPVPTPYVPIPTPPIPTPDVIPPVPPVTPESWARAVAQALGVAIPDPPITGAQVAALTQIYADFVASGGTDTIHSPTDLQPWLARIVAVFAPVIPKPGPALPSFPDGWEPDNPVSTAVAQRAAALLSTLWKGGKPGGTQVEETPPGSGHWVTYQAADHGGGVKGVTAYRVK